MGIKQELDDMLANSNGQPLFEHLLGVAFLSRAIIRSLGLQDGVRESFENAVFFAGLFHDLGKVDNAFQKYIGTRSATVGDLTDAEGGRISRFDGPFHNEISWAWLRSGFDFSGLDRRAKSAMLFSVYWHHPASCSTETSGEIRLDTSAKILASRDQCESSEDEWRIVLKFVDSLTNACDQRLGFKIGTMFSVHNCDSDDTKVPSFSQDGHGQYPGDGVAQYAANRLLMTVLIEADRRISSLSLDELKAYLGSLDEMRHVPKMEVSSCRVKAISPDSMRSFGQMELARKLANDSISVCGVDPGAGKTRIALMWWLLRTSAPRSLIVALPRQVQVTGLFHLIEKDLAEVADGWERTCVEGFFDGSRQHFSGPSEKRDLPSTSVDIRIVVFDRLLSPTYRRDQFSEYLHMLYSDLVLDEFHEFSQQHLMRPALREILQIRAWLTSGGRTLLLSGTPDPGLSRSLGLQKVFGRSELQDFQQRKVVVRSVKPDSIEIPKKDALISFNTVTQAQTCYLQLLRSGKIEKAEDVLLVHSFFVKEVRRQKVEKLLDDVKNSKGLPLTITSKMLQSSYDLDYGEGLLFLSLPNTDVQTIGRINRFGHRDGKVTFVHESEDDVLFRENLYGFSDVHKQWIEHLTVLLQGCGFEGTYREFVCKAYDEFWTEDRIKSYATYLVRQEKAVLENELKSWYPRRSLRKINSRARKIMTASFRGRSLFLSTVKWNEKNQVIGQLVGDELLSISKQWEIKHLQELAPNIAKKLKNDLRFDISKYSPGRGYKTEAPLFYGHDNSGELDVDSEICKFFRSREVKQKIYRVDLGLVEKTLVSGFPIAGVVNGSGNASGISASQKLVNIIDKQDASQKLNVRSSLVNRIDEKRSLISLSRRVPIFYVEHTKLLKGQECIRGQRKDADGVYQFDIPVASIGMMLVGPGVSITTEAARIAASRGCIIGFVGGSGLPMYAVATQHRSPLQKIKQINLVQDESARVKAGCYLLERRWDFIRKFGKVAYPRPPMLSGLSSVVEVMSAEAHWTKAYYRILAQHYKVQWRGKRALSVDGKNPLIFLNHLTYSLADMVILHLGFDPNIGILHGRTKGGGLAYDIADVVKPVLALELAFSVTNDVGLGVKLTDIKTHLFKRVVDTEAVDFLVSTLSSVFGCTHARSD